MPQGGIPVPEVGGSIGISSQGWLPVHWPSVNPVDLEQSAKAFLRNRQALVGERKRSAFVTSCSG